MERYSLHIGGQWVPSVGGEYYEAVNPHDNRPIGLVPKGDREDVRRAVAAARAAQLKLAAMSVWERSRLLLDMADAIDARADDLARILVTEQGHVLRTEAEPEAAEAAGMFRMYAEQIKWLETSYIPVQTPSKRVFSIRQPRGVYAIVTPWNFPINIPVEYLAPGLAAGNAMVWVPAPTTSAVAVKFMEVLCEADLPPGVINLVTGPGPVVGDAIVASPGTDAVGFTGSPRTGRIIAQRAAGKPLLLELGGNGPTVILDDAELDFASAQTALGCWINAGQVCCATERILVHERVHDQVVEGLVAIVSISMALTPLLLIALSRGLRALGPRGDAPRPDYDTIREDVDNRPRVLIAGMGRFGQIVARLLVAQRIPFVALESDLDTIENMRRFGNELYYGDPTRPETTMGPLNNEPTAAKNDRHIADAVAKGAKVLVGGGRDPSQGSPLFYQPTVLDACTEDMELNVEESFGPVAPVITVVSDDEALRVANSCGLGLVSAVFTKDLNRAFKFAERLQTGIVVVNDFTDYWELHIPFGGASGKTSGIGRLGGKHTIMEMSDLKTICFEVGG